jgi:hypothetical protein
VRIIAERSAFAKASRRIFCHFRGCFR